MSTRTKRLVIVLGAVTALLVTAVLMGSMAWRRVHGRLLDGSQVVLQKVSYGTNHTSPKAPLEGLLRHVPAKWSGRIRWSPSSLRTNSSTLPIFTFWLNFSSSTAESLPISYALADEDGFESPMIFAGFYGSYRPGGFSKNPAGLVRGTGVFPRRSKRFFLRLYQQAGDGKRVCVAEFPIRNLGLQNYPRWQPEALPVEHQTNGFTFALIKAEVGVSAPVPLLPPYNLQAGQWSEFRFRVRAQGQLAGDWMIREIMISDATGNELRVSGQDSGAFNHQLSHVEGGDIVCLHRWDFWTDESAWKLSVHFEQPASTGSWVEFLVRPTFLKGRSSSERHGEQTRPEHTNTTSRIKTNDA